MTIILSSSSLNSGWRLKCQHVEESPERPCSCECGSCGLRSNLNSEFPPQYLTSVSVCMWLYQIDSCESFVSVYQSLWRGKMCVWGGGCLKLSGPFFSLWGKIASKSSLQMLAKLILDVDSGFFHISSFVQWFARNPLLGQIQSCQTVGTFLYMSWAKHNEATSDLQCSAPFNAHNSECVKCTNGDRTCTGYVPKFASDMGEARHAVGVTASFSCDHVAEPQHKTARKGEITSHYFTKCQRFSLHECTDAQWCSFACRIALNCWGGRVGLS